MSRAIVEELYKDLVDMYFDFVCDFYIPNDLTDELYGFILDVEKDLNQSPYYKVYKYSDSQPRDDHGRWTDGGGSSESSGGSNYAKPLDMLDYSNIPSSEQITAEKIIADLQRTDIGKETLKTIESLPQPIKFTYGEYSTGYRGEERNGRIIIYLNNCKNTLWAARSVIHECTHYRYGIGYSQWAECVCVAQELKHARGRNKLTYNELKSVVRAVKDAYPEFNWRKGGIIHGKRRSR